MNKYILTAIALITSILVGCSTGMKEITSIANKIEASTTASEESTHVNSLMSILSSKRIPIILEVSENNIEIPISEIPQHLDKQLTVNVIFPDESEFHWNPIENQNIYLLMRE